MLAPRIKVDRDLYARLCERAEEKGFSSVEEYIREVLEREARVSDTPNDEAILQERLRGLGYVE